VTATDPKFQNSRLSERILDPIQSKAITPGDVVTVTRIDRLARSTFDLFAIVKQIVDAGGPGCVNTPGPLRRRIC